MAERPVVFFVTTPDFCKLRPFGFVAARLVAFFGTEPAFCVLRAFGLVPARVGGFLAAVLDFLAGLAFGFATGRLVVFFGAGFCALLDLDFTAGLVGGFSPTPVFVFGAIFGFRPELTVDCVLRGTIGLDLSGLFFTDLTVGSFFVVVGFGRDFVALADAGFCGWLLMAGAVRSS